MRRARPRAWALLLAPMLALAACVRGQRAQGRVNQIAFANGGAELHHAVTARHNQGATIDQAQEFFTTEDFKGPPPVDFDASEITAVLDRGGKQIETVELQSGSYALLCFLTDRAGSPPHLIKAKMIQEVKVP